MVIWDCLGFAFLRCVIGPENLIQSLDRVLIKTSTEQNDLEIKQSIFPWPNTTFND